jgi:tetratricopeptide (TPR) repeat protein
MEIDNHGLEISTQSPDASRAFSQTIVAYLKYRVETPQHLAATLEADPAFALAHCMKGYFAMLSYKQANVAAAQAALDTAGLYSGAITPRERAHLNALKAWISGDLDEAIAIWNAVLADHPLDIVAFRLAHFTNFWLGRPKDMLVSAEQVFPHWDKAFPGYVTILGCRAFAYEECGQYRFAESTARLALDLDASDLWAAHALTHVMEMEGRHVEGIDLLRQLEPNWTGCINLVHHVWWHRAMFHLERREFEEVLDLYDTRFRRLNSPLTMAQPDQYLDMQNAISMLFRLERQQIDVGDRWLELADKAEGRVGDCLSAFTMPHWVMALGSTGRHGAALHMISAARNHGGQGGTVTKILATVGIPVMEAVLANRRGRHMETIDLMTPVFDDLDSLGGSHAQQDFLEQVYLDSAMKADRFDAARLLLNRVRSRHPVPPEMRIGYATAARRLAH